MIRILTITLFTLIMWSLNVSCQMQEGNGGDEINTEASAENNGDSLKGELNSNNEKETMVLISTVHGDIKVKLYNETPKHRDNFIKLAEEGYYDGTLFHRVMQGFMIQGGDPDSKGVEAGVMLGNGGPDYTIPANFNENLFHKKGALAAAREGDHVNPTKASSGSQFYIVQGEVYTEERLKELQDKRNNYYKNKLFGEFMERPENAELKDRWVNLTKDPIQPKENQPKMLALHKEVDSLVTKEFNEKNLSYEMSEEQIEAYTTIGGTPHLDMEYTVFGEVVEGMGVIDKIAMMEVDDRNRPKIDVEMKMKVIK